MSKVMVMVGTKRGLFVFSSTLARRRWTAHGPYLKGWEIAHAILDVRGRTPRMLAAGRSPVFGPLVSRSDSFGKRWQRAQKGLTLSEYPKDKIKEMEKFGISTIRRVWHLEPGPATEPGVLYAGVAPAALFRSEDGGAHWREVRSLSEHPTRKMWQPGAGGMCLHSIQLDPTNPRRMYVGISAAGVFRTDDGGKSWTPINKGIRNPFGPPSAIAGNCVHKLLVHPARPSRLYQQHHFGVYRSDNAGETWAPIDQGLPLARQGRVLSAFGFPLALHPRDPETCYVVPLMPEEGAWRATAGRLSVFKASRGGRSWTRLSQGLPQRDAYLSVLREGMASDALDPCGIYVGTGGGHLFFSRDEGRRWQSLASYLPPILSVSVAALA